MHNPILTNERIAVLDKFTTEVLDAYKSGKIDLLKAKTTIGHIYSAIDKRNETEVISFPTAWKS